MPLSIWWFSIRFKPHSPREIQIYARATYSCHLGDAIAFVFQIRKCCTPSHTQYRLTKWRPILTKMLSSIEKHYWNLTLKGLLDLIRDYKLLGYFLNQILGILHHIFSYICCHVSTFFCKPDMLLETLKNLTIYLFRSVHILYL